MSKKLPKTLQKLNLTDRFLFDSAMEEPKVYETMLEILLEKQVHLLDAVHTERELRVSPLLRSIRLDVVSMDEVGELYYTEMQKENTRNLPKTSRYYQGQTDVSLLAPGVMNFNLLNDTCMILVTPFDIFGKGLYRYTFEERCLECPELGINDGATRIFINTKGKNREDFSQEFLDFMEYIMDTREEVALRSSSEKLHLIHRSVEKIRQSEQMGVRYMQKWEERIYDRMEGRQDGEQLKLICQIQKKILKDKSLEIISEELEEEPENIRELYEIISRNPQEAPEKILENLCKQ